MWSAQLQQSWGCISSWHLDPALPCPQHWSACSSPHLIVSQLPHLVILRPLLHHVTEGHPRPGGHVLCGGDQLGV